MSSVMQNLNIRLVLPRPYVSNKTQDSNLNKHPRGKPPFNNNPGRRKNSRP